MVCLSRRLDQVGALIDLFVRRADGKLVDDAIKLVGDLEPLPTCANSAALLKVVSLPADPVRRARVTELERQVDRADLEREAGRPQAAADAARAVLDAERAINHAPIAAQAGRVLGRSLEDVSRPAEAREALLRAQRLAERAGDIRLATHILIDLLFVVGFRDQRHAEAHLLAALTEAALERPELRNDQAMRARLLNALGAIANDEKHGDRAIELQREALGICRRIMPQNLPDVATAETNLGAMLSDEARYEEARVHHLEALAIRRRVFGDEHPQTAVVHHNLGRAYLDGKSEAEARKHYLTALSIFRRMPASQFYPLLLNDLGNLEHTAGNYDQARSYYEAALAVRLRELGPDHPDVAMSLSNLGNVLVSTGHFTKALELHRRALALKEKAPGKDHPSYALTLIGIGEDKPCPPR